MVERIPQRIDYYRYTDKGVVLEGVIKQQELRGNFPRLYDAIVKTAGDIEYYLQFDVDMSSNRIVTGWVKTQVMLQCQRCMSDYEQRLNCAISTAFVQNDYEAKQAESSDYDVFFVGKEEGIDRKELLDPRVLLEDELLLMLPQIPRHSDTGSGTSCHVQFDYPVEHGRLSKQDKQQGDRDNPFAILKQLRK